MDPEQHGLSVAGGQTPSQDGSNASARQASEALDQEIISLMEAAKAPPTKALFRSLRFRF